MYIVIGSSKVLTPLVHQRIKQRFAYFVFGRTAGMSFGAELNGIFAVTKPRNLPHFPILVPALKSNSRG